MDRQLEARRGMSTPRLVWLKLRSWGELEVLQVVGTPIRFTVAALAFAGGATFVMPTLGFAEGATASAEGTDGADERSRGAVPR